MITIKIQYLVFKNHYDYHCDMLILQNHYSNQVNYYFDSSLIDLHLLLNQLSHILLLYFLLKSNFSL